MPTQPNNPLHGVTLKKILEYLEQELGWEEMGQRVNIRCFKNDPSINSSLKFLRRTPWARQEVEELYLRAVSGKPLPNPQKRRPRPPQPERPDDGMDW